eukprot:m.219150 g.219150  ORF g.219150 m.219150 type:complete len:245 (+) comp30358_c0_seq1:63-797(+)
MSEVGYGPRLSFARPASAGDVPVNWIAAPEPLVYQDSESWNRAAGSDELVAYPSLVVDPIDSNVLWFYYTYLEPGATFINRYFVRRRVDTVTMTADFNGASTVMSLYQGTARLGARDGDYWATTAPVPPDANYSQVDGAVGAILVSPGPNRVRLFDCYTTAWDDHMVGFEHECSPGRPGPMVGLRTLGFALTPTGSAQAIHAGLAVVEVFRCFNNATKNHAVSVDPECRGRGTTEFSLGFFLSP